MKVSVIIPTYNRYNSIQEAFNKNDINAILTIDDRNLALALIDLANSERIDLTKVETKQPLKFSVDVINWRKNKFRDPLKNLKMPEKTVNFLISKNQASVIEGFQKRFNTYKDKDFYNAAMDFVQPRKYLLHNLSYDE